MHKQSYRLPLAADAVLVQCGERASRVNGCSFSGAVVDLAGRVDHGPWVPNHAAPIQGRRRNRATTSGPLPVMPRKLMRPGQQWMRTTTITQRLTHRLMLAVGRSESRRLCGRTGSGGRALRLGRYDRPLGERDRALVGLHWPRSSLTSTSTQGQRDQVECVF